MPRRVMDRPMPMVGTIDLCGEKSRGSMRGGAISRQLHMAMREALDDGGQVILLLNRRGYSTHIQCTACGFVLKCPDCDIALTHHRTEEVALCHYCDHEVPAPRACPECGFTGIRYSGLGTQRLEAEVHRSLSVLLAVAAAASLAVGVIVGAAADALHSGAWPIVVGLAIVVLYGTHAMIVRRLQ